MIPKSVVKQPLLLVIPPLSLFLALVLFTSLVVLEGIPHSQDEVVYLFQAKILRAGHLYLPSLPDGVRQFFDHEFVVNDGKWYGKYSPGLSLFQATGLDVGMPALVNPLLGALSLVALYGLAVRFYSRSTALLAASLYAVSPFSILQSANFMSHQLVQLLTILFFTAVLAGSRDPAGRRTTSWALIAGLSLGGIFMTRPFNLFPLLPFAGIYLAVLYVPPPGRERAWRPLLAFCLTAAALGVANLGYNLALTGNPLKFPHMAYSRYDTLGFGLRGVEWGARFGPDDAIDHVKANFTSLRRWFFAWPGFMPAALLPLAFLRKNWRTSLFLLAFVPLQVLGYALYFHPGTFMGPRYWYEATWVLYVLVAEGAMVPLTLVKRVAGQQSATAVYAAILVVTVGFSVLRDAQLLPAFKGYNRMYRVALTEVQAPAIVLVPSEEDWQSYGRYFIRQSPFLDSEPIIFARDQARHNVWKQRPPIDNAKVLDYFSGRNVYFLQP